jgi:hypothetical protein
MGEDSTSFDFLSVCSLAYLPIHQTKQRKNKLKKKKIIEV